MKDLEGQIETASKGREEAIKQLRKLQVREKGRSRRSSSFSTLCSFILLYLILNTVFAFIIYFLQVLVGSLKIVYKT